MDINILLIKLARPAQRAILSTDVATLEQLAEMTEDEISNLHGIGKNALEIVKSTLEENGLSLAAGR